MTTVREFYLKVPGITRPLQRDTMGEWIEPL